MAARLFHDPRSPKPRSVDRHTDSAEVQDELTRLAELRRRQLAALADDRSGAVAAAYRDSVLRALDEVRLAEERLTAGLYGVCVECAGRIARDLLRRRPSATACLPCVRAGLHGR